MISVLLNNTERLIADIIHDTRKGSGAGAGAGPVWVCVRAGSRAAGKGWLGCWSSKQAAPEETEVREFLSTLGKDLTGHVSQGPYGLALSDHHFHEGWQSWGPGTPGPLVEAAGEPSPADEAPRRIQDLHLDTEG